MNRKEAENKTVGFSLCKFQVYPYISIIFSQT